jgi:hypothetical protein
MLGVGWDQLHVLAIGLSMHIAEDAVEGHRTLQTQYPHYLYSADCNVSCLRRKSLVPD